MSDEVKHVGPKAVVDATALLDLVTATNGLLSTIDDLPAKQLENERAHFVVLARRAVDRVKVMRFDEPKPIPMLLLCPECRHRHVDEGEFAIRPHHTHACQECGWVWRPAVVDTVGVRFLPGFKDT